MAYGAIPDEIIQNVLRKTDIVELIGRTVPLSKRGRSYTGLCPFHSEKTPSFHVLPDKQIFHCFGCGAGGNAIRFIMRTEGLSFPEAVRALAESAEVVYAFDEGPAELTPEQQEARRMTAANEEASKFFHFVLNGTEQGQEAYRYLRDRGFSQRLIDEFQLGFAPPMWDSLNSYLQSKGYEPELLEKAGLILPRNEGGGFYDRFRSRVMFPIRDASGRVIAFGGRAIGDEQPKYLNSPDTTLFHKSRVLYLLDAAKAGIRRTRQAVLFEGYVDVIKAWEAGIDNGVATLGTALTEAHVNTLKRYCGSVIICYDGDRAGAAAAHRSLLLCEKMGFPAKVAMLPDGMDPDEYIESRGADTFRSTIIGGAVAATKYKILYLKKEHKLQDDGDKIAFVREAVRMIAQLDSPTEREHYLRDLNVDVGYSFETLKQEMNEFRQKAEGGRDKNAIPWNTVMNDKGSVSSPPLRPAYYQAERLLLSVMMHDADTALAVQAKLGDGFHVEAHAALAAYLYAYYADGKPPNPSAFISGLQDDTLEAAASSILLGTPQEAVNEKVVEHALLEIRKHSIELELKQKKQMQNEAARAGNIAASAQIGIEMITLEKELKVLAQRF